MSANPINSNRYARSRGDSCVSRCFHPYSGRNINNSGLERADSPAGSHRQHVPNQASSPMHSRLRNNALHASMNDQPILFQRVTSCPYSTHDAPSPLRVCQRTNYECPHQRMRHSFPPPITRQDYFYSHQLRFSSPPLPRPPHLTPSRVLYHSPNGSAARRNPISVRETIPTIEMRPAVNKTSAQGTRSFSFQPTPGEDDDALQSVTAMRVYRDKSLEELRLEDYQKGNKGNMTAKVEEEDKDYVDDKAEQEKKEQNRCVICLESRKSVLILPCSHMCICAECSDDKSLEKCPICRSSIEGKLFVYW